MFHTHGLATAHERTAPTLGRAAAKEGAGQDLPEPLGPAASQTLDPPAGISNAQGLAHRNPPPLPNACGELIPAGNAAATPVVLEWPEADLHGV